MNTDYSYCSGVTCSIRKSCKRYLPDPPDTRLQWGMASIQSEQSNGHSFDSNGGEWDAPYSSSEGLSTLRFPTSIEKKKWENEDGCSVQPAGNVRRASFAERWKNFPTQSPVCSRDDGISTRLDGIAFSKWRQESIKAYGNAIVPQVMYEIFQAIQETYNQ